VSPRYRPHLAARHVAKSHKATPPGSKVLAANMLHFKPIFDPPLTKVVKGASVTGGGALIGLCHSLAPVKIWGCSTPWESKYDLSKKSIWVEKH